MVTRVRVFRKTTVRPASVNASLVRLLMHVRTGRPTDVAISPGIRGPVRALHNVASKAGGENGIPENVHRFLWGMRACRHSL